MHTPLPPRLMQMGFEELLGYLAQEARASCAVTPLHVSGKPGVVQHSLRMTSHGWSGWRRSLITERLNVAWLRWTFGRQA